MHHRSRSRLLAGAALALTLGAGGALAQEEPAAEASDSRDTITVTGSRIRNSGFQTPTPVAVVSSEELEMANPGNIVTAVVQLPQFYNSTTTSDTAGFFQSPGAGNLNLRGLEPARTLTLLNGRRMVSSTRYGGTDINTFPEEMVKSVEAVTGGASAQYGSDAVSGVVNFILDTDFVGLRQHAQYGITDRGDNESWEAGISFGADLGDRAHVLFSAETYEQDGVFTYDGRDWYQQWGLVQPGGAGTARLLRPGVTSTTATLNGVIAAPQMGFDLDFDPATPNVTLPALSFHRYELLPDGVTTQPFVMGPEGNAGGGYASHAAAPGTSGTDNNVHPTLQPETSRQSYFGYLDFDVSDDLTVFGQAIWGRNDTRVSDLGGFFAGTFAPLIIHQGNPFLPAEINQAMIDQGRPFITVEKVGSELDTSNRYDITENTMQAFTTGFDWSLFDEGFGGWLQDWTASAYAQWGETSYNQIVRGGLRIDRLPMAVDAVVDPDTGEIVCRVNTEPFLTNNGGRWSDCVPINLFGQGNASPEALDWILGYDPGEEIDTVLEFPATGTSLGYRDNYISSADKISSGEIEQEVYEIAFDGNVWEGWGAGPIAAAFGYSYRSESIFQVVRDPANPTNADSGRPVPPNDNYADGNTANDLGVRGGAGGNIANSVAIQFSKMPNVMGELSTIEYFGELLVPVVADQFWMNQLNVSLAARRADYSGSGEIWAWKYGVDAQITDDLRIRATQSRDSRAATLAERFDRTGGFATVNWTPAPCATPTGPGACPVFTVSGGNPEVKPETADTTTVGVVYQPGWLDGFSVSLDWYDIDLQDAIAQLTAAQIVQECLLGDDVLCARITLNDQGQPTLINQSYLNLNKAKVTGWDVEAAYRTPVDWLDGNFAVRLYAGYLEENSRSNFGQPTFFNEGGFLYPELKLTGSIAYDRGPLTLFVQERYISETVLNTQWREGPGAPSTNPADNIWIDDNSVDDVLYTDFNASYRFDTAAGEVQLFGNIINLTDEDPPVVANFANFGANATQTGGQFDRLGRRYIVGVRLRH